MKNDVKFIIQLINSVDDLEISALNVLIALNKFNTTIENLRHLPEDPKE